MKITVKNLGAVKQAEIDLKPLTVFVGHNATGKTWTAYALAAIFSSYGFKKYVDSYLDSKTEHRYSFLDQVVSTFLQEGSAELDIVEFAKQNLQIYINEVAKLAPTWLGSFLSTRRVIFDDLSIAIDLGDSKDRLIEKIKNVSAYAELTLSSRELNFLKETDNKLVFFSMEARKKTKLPLPEQRVKRFVCGGVFGVLQRVFFEYTHLFPTERTTFITIPVTKEKDGDAKIEQDEDAPSALNFSGPVSSFISMIRSTPSVSLQNRQNTSSVPLIQDYLKLADLLESEILNGKGGFEEVEFGQELLFTTENIKLEMDVTSSMTKELMPLVLYLRYWAEPNDLIVIDEPEMNLHPAAQVEIIEFLAMLVNAGLNVLVTTHSPYIVDHLSNLIAAAKQPNPENIQGYFYLEDARAFIAQDKVSVQLFEDHTARNILDENGSIHWETFWNVSSDISGIYAELLKHRAE